MTHCVLAIDLCRSVPSLSNATLTIVVSRAPMIDPMLTTKAIRQTWDSIRSDTVVLITRPPRLAGGEVAAAWVVADEARELPLLLGDRASAAPELELVRAG